MRLADKIAVVTGAAKGIGKAIAEGMAKEGAFVLISDIDINEATKTADGIKDLGYQAKPLLFDVSDKNQVQQRVDEIIAEFGGVDVLVNNAGVAGVSNIFNTSEEEINRIININLKGVIYCCQAVAKNMAERKYGKIINVSSVAGKIGGGLLGTSIYAASKAGVIGLTKGYAKELAPFGVNVNGIAPGSIDTEITERYLTPEKRLKSIEKIPLGRRGTTKDLVGAAVFLASDESSFITGATIDVNGGSFME